MKHIIIYVFLLSSFVAHAQSSNHYNDSISKARQLFQNKEYAQAAIVYSHAFAANKGKATTEDRYNAACAWAKANKTDSAFHLLFALAGKGKFTYYNELLADADLIDLHTDERWEKLCAEIKHNKEKAELHINKKLASELEGILNDDQKYRGELDSVQAAFGFDSKEVRNVWNSINLQDSIDLVKVERILKKYGWLGADVVGEDGNAALFLVIQHSNTAAQKKYLPMLRDAVKQKKADATNLALLEDRVALSEGKKQIYGSQISGDNTGQYWVRPLQDPENVDKRRAKVGLPPMAEYVSHWKIKWDATEYKKQLPLILKKEQHSQ